MEEALLHFVAASYNLMGWVGVIVLMAIESACIPLPSEIIMPLSGWMLIQAKSLPVLYTLIAGVYGALGCVIGSMVAYGAGMWGGRPFLEKYGKYVLISRHDLDLADRWFDKYGSWTVFTSRLLPVVRTFISLPAGIARTKFIPFLIYTFIGSFIWCTALAYGGYQLGQHWDEIRNVMRPLDPLIGALIVAAIALYVYRHIKHLNKA